MNTRTILKIEKEKEKAYNVQDKIYNQDNKKNTRNVKIKMDSACSRNMSGVAGRIHDTYITDKTIKGFKGEESKANLIGKNNDNKEELYVQDMQEI